MHQNVAVKYESPELLLSVEAHDDVVDAVPGRAARRSGQAEKIPMLEGPRVTVAMAASVPQFGIAMRCRSRTGDHPSRESDMLSGP